MRELHDGLVNDGEITDSHLSMRAIRKPLFLALLTLGAVISLALALVLAPSASPPPGTLAVHYVTTNTTGKPMALMELTLRQTAWARFSSIDIKRVHGWQRMHHVPTNVLVQVDGLCTVTFRSIRKGAAQKAGWIEFPTNSNWKLRLELSQSRSGIGGLVDRMFHARSYYRSGGWSNVMHGTRPVPYVGRSWRIESEEIRMPLAE
jgi:hypothetical protein